MRLKYCDAVNESERSLSIRESAGPVNGLRRNRKRCEIYFDDLEVRDGSLGDVCVYAAALLPSRHL